MDVYRCGIDRLERFDTVGEAPAGRTLSLLRELVEDAISGHSRLAVVGGPPGKSAILAALGAHATERGMRVLRASGLELERGYPFGVVRQLFEPVVFSLDGAARKELFAGSAAPAEALLGGRWSLSGPEVLDPSFALLHGLYWLLVGLIERGPLAVLVDDVQWADRPSLRLTWLVLFDRCRQRDPRTLGCLHNGVWER